MNHNIFKSLILLTVIGLIACTVLGCLHNPERFYFGDYSQAELFYSKGEYERAIQKYQAFMDTNPEGNMAVIAMYYMARSYQYLDRNDEAKTIYEAIIKNHRESVWANFSESHLKELSNPQPNAA